MTKSKRICFLMPGWIHKHSGGAEIQLYYITNELVNRGWKVEVVTASAKGNKLNPEFDNSSITFHYYNNSKSKIIAIFYAYLSLKKTKSSYYYLRTDAKALRTALRFFKSGRKIGTLYALALDKDAENLTYLKLNKSNNILRILDSFIADIIDFKSIYSFNKIICQTNHQKNILLEKTGINGEVIYNSFIDQKTNSDFDKENIIIWVGNMREQKNPEALFKLIQKLVLKDWKFCVIGRNANYKSKIEEINNKGIEFLGELSHKETIEYFKKAKVIINTSFQEGFSNTFIQAWYYRVWLETYCVDPDNIIRDKGFGLSHNSNLISLINKIQTIIENPDIITANKIEEAHDFVNKKFNLSNNVGLLETLIEKI